jgi:hypothetical protein
MTAFDDLFRDVAGGVLDDWFSEPVEARYFDGTGTLVGSYTILLGPEKAEEGTDDRGYRNRYRRPATINKSPGMSFDAVPIEVTGSFVVTEDEEDVTYAVAEITARTQAAVSMTLRRTGAVRRRAQGE